LRRLREARADTEATTATNASKLSRITVQRDGLQVRVTQLERDLEEQKDNGSKLQRQLDNWQNLKKGNHADLETLRKKKTELEVEVTEAQAEVERLQKVVEKERGRVAKLKDVLSEWKVSFSPTVTLYIQHILCRPNAMNSKRVGKRPRMRLQLQRRQ
jgi:chromosome segregation ATPase